MRSEEVLNGVIIREGECVPCCAECEDKCFVKTQHFMCKSRVVTRLDPHARVAHVRDADQTSCEHYKRQNHVCGNATLRAGLVSCVHTRRLQRDDQQISHSMMMISTMKLLAHLRMKSLMVDGRTTSNRFGVDTLGTIFGPIKLSASSLSNLILGMDSGVALSMLLIQSLFSSVSFLVIVSLTHRSVFTRSVLCKFPRSFISAPLCRCRDVRVIFGCSRVVAGA